MPILLKLFQKVKRLEIPSNSLYKTSTTLTLKPDEENTSKETCRPVSLMTADANMLNRILANQTQ